MRALIFVLALFPAASQAITYEAEEQSREEYIKEINKAFDRVFEATHGKTFSGKIIALEKLSVEFQDNKPVSDLLLQERGTTYSFMGQHQNALRAFDQHDPTPEPLNDRIKSLTTQDAVHAILEKSAHHQIVMINEAHHVPQHRVLTYRLLAGLWEKGYRYLALEALSPDAENHLTKKYVTKNAGFYTVEPIFANLVLHAQKLGFKLVSYDFGSELMTGTEAREKSATRNLRQKIFNSTPEAKVIIHVGYNHINEDEWLAYYLKTALNIDPLTINQTEFTERSATKFEPESYRWLVENHVFENPVILTDRDGKFWSSTPKKYDVNVVWPRTQYSLNRPSWAGFGRNLTPIDMAWCHETFPCTVEVYRVGEDDEVPTDRIVLSEKNVRTGVFISTSSNFIKITDTDNRLLHTEPLQ